MKFSPMIAGFALISAFSLSSVTVAEEDVQALVVDNGSNQDSNGKKKAKVAVCHQTKGPFGSVKIEVSGNALAQHLAHGDVIATNDECPDDTQI